MFAGCGAWKNEHHSEPYTPAPSIASHTNGDSSAAPVSSKPASSVSASTPPSAFEPSGDPVGNHDSSTEPPPPSFGVPQCIQPPCPGSPFSSTAKIGYCTTSFQSRFEWPDPAQAARVCYCESKGNPDIVSPNGLYRGLFQFSDNTWKSLGGGNVFNPYLNSERAVQLYKKRGWKPWPRCAKEASR